MEPEVSLSGSREDRRDRSIKLFCPHKGFRVAGMAPVDGRHGFDRRDELAGADFNRGAAIRSLDGGDGFLATSLLYVWVFPLQFAQGFARKRGPPVGGDVIEDGFAFRTVKALSVSHICSSMRVMPGECPADGSGDQRQRAQARSVDALLQSCGQ